LKLAYVDSSCWVAIALAEPAGEPVVTRLKSFDRLFASNLLEAELRSALFREQVEDSAEKLLSWLSWIHPDRPLTPELDKVLAKGYVRGADLWHLACALYLRAQVGDLGFLSLDTRQAEVAGQLGFHDG
jgi:predicted nucleic acid-binding protein